VHAVLGRHHLVLRRRRRRKATSAGTRLTRPTDPNASNASRQGIRSKTVGTSACIEH
jgi:hypothetical protein